MIRIALIALLLAQSEGVRPRAVPSSRRRSVIE